MGIAGAARICPMSVADRFRAALKHSGLTQSAAEEAAGASRGYLSRVLDGSRQKLRAETISAFAKVFGVSQNWLADGSGEMGDALATPAGPTATAQAPTGRATALAPSAPARWVETTPRYMNLEVAVRRAAEAGRAYPEDAIRAANILMRRDYDPSPEEWAQLLEVQATVASKFERRERLVLEHEVVAPDASVLGRGRGKR